MAEPRFALPARAVVATIVARDGVPLRAMFAPADTPRGLLLFLNGRADFLEKWAEVYPVLLAEGWSLLSGDWRGQGLSGRQAPNGAGHLDDFGRLADDLDTLVVWGRGQAGDLPMAAMAHSMGGHALLCWLAAGGAVERAVLLAPLVALHMYAPLWSGLRWMAARRVAAGRGGDYAAGQGPYSPARRSPARALLLSHDRDRFADESDWIAHDPRLEVGGVSWGWLDALARSRAVVQAAAPTIATPMLLLLAEHERLVSNAAALRLAARLPDARALVIAGAAHELLREAEPMRRDALSRALAFVATVRR